MKKLSSTLLFLLSILPSFAAPRDDTETGWGLGGTLLFFTVLIIWMIVSVKNENKNN